MNLLPCMIVLEGPDGAGKSTLATALSRMTGFAYQHFTAPAKGTSFDATCRQSLDRIRADGKNVIVDRFHLSERVYGPLLRGADTMTETFEQTVWEAVRPVVVMCLPPYRVAFENWAKRKAANGELVTKSEQYEAVYLAYENLRTTLPILQYDYTRDRAVDLCERLAIFAFSALSATPR
jgi:thymidylate kinase